MNREVYEKNIQAMEKRFPGMLQLIEKKKQEKERSTDNITIKTEQALDGTSIIVIKKDERSLYVSGKRQPRETAKRIIKNWGKLSKVNTIFLTGMADIVFFKELIENTEKEVNIVLYEPSFQIFLSLLEDIDMTIYFDNRPIGLIVEGLNEEEFNPVIGAFLNLSNVEFIKHYENAAYYELFQQEIVGVMRKIDRKITEIVSSKNTGIRYSAVEADNLFHNIKYLCDGSITTQLCDIIPNDIPAILVSAGPSLNKNIKELKKAKNKAFIVAVDTAVRPLVKAGIIPDMYVVVDGLKPIELFEFEEAKKIPLMTSISAAKRILELHEGKKIFWFEGHSFIWSLMAMNGISFATVACGGSVACSAFSLIYKLGFSKIILVGQDLALTGNKTHADGTFKEKMEEIDTSHNLMVDGNYEEKVPTRGDFKMYLDWFNYYINGCEGIHVINATEGGAKIENTEIMTLKDAIERECGREVDIEECFSKLTPIFNEEQRKRAVEYLNTIPQMFKNMKQEAQRLHTYYKKLNRICKAGKLDKKAYLKTLKRIKKSTKALEGHELYIMIGSTLSVADYIIMSEQFYEEDTLEAEGLEIARKGMKYMELVEQCIDLLIPLTEETVGQMK